MNVLDQVLDSSSLQRPSPSDVIHGFHDAESLASTYPRKGNVKLLKVAPLVLAIALIMVAVHSLSLEPISENLPSELAKP